MPNVLYGDLGSERMLYNTNQLSESIISGLYNACTGRTLGYCYTGNKCGLWYLIDKFGARGGGYLSGTYGAIGGVPADVFLGDLITYCSIDEFKNESVEGSCHFPLEGNYLPDLSHAALIVDKLFGALSSGTRLWLDFENPTATEEEHIKRGIEYLSFILYALPPALQTGISFASNLSSQKLTGAKVDIAVLPYGFMSELSSQEAAWLEPSVIHCDRPAENYQCSGFAYYIASLVTKEAVVDEPAEAFMSELINMDIYASDDNREAYVYPYLYQLYHALVREDAAEAFQAYKELRGYRCFRYDRTDILPAFLEEMRLQDIQDTENYYASYPSYEEPESDWDAKAFLEDDSFNNLSLDYENGNTEDISNLDKSECVNREKDLNDRIQELASKIIELDNKRMSAEEERNREIAEAERDTRKKKDSLKTAYEQKQRQLDDELAEKKRSLKEKYEAIISSYEKEIDDTKALQGKMKSDQLEIEIRLKTLLGGDIKFDSKQDDGFMDQVSTAQPVQSTPHVQSTPPQSDTGTKTVIPTVKRPKSSLIPSAGPKEESKDNNPDHLDIQAFEGYADKCRDSLRMLTKQGLFRNDEMREKLENALIFDLGEHRADDNTVVMKNILLPLDMNSAMDEFGERVHYSLQSNAVDDPIVVAAFGCLESYTRIFYVGFVSLALRAGYNPIRIRVPSDKGTDIDVPMTGEHFVNITQSVYHALLGKVYGIEEEINFCVRQINIKLNDDEFFHDKFCNISENEKYEYVKALFIEISLFVISVVTGCFGSKILADAIDDKKIQQARMKYYLNWHLEEKVDSLQKLSGKNDSGWEKQVNRINELLIEDKQYSDRINKRLESLLKEIRKRKKH